MSWTLVSPRIKLARQERIITLQTSRWNLKGYRYFLLFHLNVRLFGGDKHLRNLLFKQYCIFIEYCVSSMQFECHSVVLSCTHYFTLISTFPGLFSICHISIPMEFPTFHPPRKPTRLTVLEKRNILVVRSFCSGCMLVTDWVCYYSRFVQFLWFYCFYRV